MLVVQNLFDYSQLSSQLDYFEYQHCLMSNTLRLWARKNRGDKVFSNHLVLSDPYRHASSNFLSHSAKTPGPTSLSSSHRQKTQESIREKSPTHTHSLSCPGPICMHLIEGAEVALSFNSHGGDENPLGFSIITKQPMSRVHQVTLP